MAETIDTTKRGVLKSAALAMPVLAFAGGAAAAAWTHPMDALTPSQKSFAMAAMRAVAQLARTTPLALAALGESHCLNAILVNGLACGEIEHGQAVAALAGVAEGKSVCVFVRDDGPLLAEDAGSYRTILKESRT